MLNMTQTEFKSLPLLLFEHHVIEITGYARNTLRKMTDCAVLNLVKPKGCGQARYQKKQIAQLVGWEGLLKEDQSAWSREALLLPEKTVTRYTGFSADTLRKISHAGGLNVLRPAGIGSGRYRKVQISELVGF